MLYDKTCIKDLKVLAVLHRKPSETFKCNIPAFPPVIYARCCKSIVGCRACGLHDLIGSIVPLLVDPQTDPEDAA